MKKNYLLALVLAVVLMATPAMAWNLGYSFSSSDYSQTSSGWVGPGTSGGVTTNTDSFHAVGVLGSGTVFGSNYSGGYAVTTNINPISAPPGQDPNPGGHEWNATQNSGGAVGGFSYSIQTGSKNFLWIIPPVAGGIGGTKGDVSQWSADGSNVIGLSGGLTGSYASQNSAAGFCGADADLLIGKDKSPVTGLFTGNSLVNGGTYSYSYRGNDGLGTKFIGTESGAGNSANTIITGGIGSGYAGGNGQTFGGSSINPTGLPPSVHASTSGMYAGQFSYSGNGNGNVAGYSQSYGTAIPYGYVFGTYSGVSVNMP